MTIQDEIFEARLNAAVDEVLADMDRRTDERIQIYVQEALQREMVALYERKEAA